MATSIYSNIGITARNSAFADRVRGCIAQLRDVATAPTAGKATAEETANDEHWLPYWMWRVAADDSVYSRYWGVTGMGATPPNENVATDTAVISDGILTTAVKSVLGIA